ncbi:MAG: sodium:glutamate symporter [Desulfobacteraceae bacterium]|nr:sodium:glutamate symporter [Desulfobacteraceae bacterium]
MDGVFGLFFSVCVLSIFLLIGKSLRVRVKLFQRLFLPSSIIAGFVLLACGPFGLNLFPEWMIAYWRQIPGVLINVVFASLFLGVALPKPKKLWDIGGPQLCYGMVAGMGQYFIAMLITVLVLGPLFGTPDVFSCIVEIGFSGGHGTAAGMGPVFEKIGFQAGSDLAQMAATVGIVSAVVFGIIMINIAIRKGYCVCLNEEKGIPTYKRIGLIPEQKRYSIATATVATEAIEPLTFHFAIIGIAIFIGWIMLQGIQAIHPILASFPLFPMAMIGGLLIQAISTPFNIDHYYDKDTFDRILGFSLDVLVISAIAGIRMDLFIQNLWPFVIIMITGVSWMIFATLVIAPRMFPTNWFERGITEYGMQTGVTAMGLLLLRLVDPMYKTDTATAFGFKQMVYEPFMGGGLITALAPFIIINLGIWPSIAASGFIMLIFVMISRTNGWTQPSRKKTIFAGKKAKAN